MIARLLVTSFLSIVGLLLGNTLICLFYTASFENTYYIILYMILGIGTFTLVLIIQKLLEPLDKKLSDNIAERWQTGLENDDKIDKS